VLGTETWHSTVQPGREFSQLKNKKSVQLFLTNIHVIKWKLVDLEMYFSSALFKASFYFKKSIHQGDYSINIVLLHLVILKKSKLLSYCKLGNSDDICKC